MVTKVVSDVGRFSKKKPKLQIRISCKKLIAFSCGLKHFVLFVLNFYVDSENGIENLMRFHLMV